MTKSRLCRNSGRNRLRGVSRRSENPDGSPNLYRDFRFLMYNVSRLGTDTSGSGGAGTYTLETICWPGNTDHFILTPVSPGLFLT